MNTIPTTWILADAELDMVTGGGHRGGGGGTTVNIIEVSVGEIIATGNSTISINVVTSGGGHHSGHRR